MPKRLQIPRGQRKSRKVIHGVFLRPANFLLQSGAILRDALQMVLVAITSIRDAAQLTESTRKDSFFN
jgi:hypothetical protein